MFAGLDLGAEGGLKLTESLRALTTLHSLRLHGTTFFPPLRWRELCGLVRGRSLYRPRSAIIIRSRIRMCGEIDGSTAIITLVGSLFFIIEFRLGSGLALGY